MVMGEKINLGGGWGWIGGEGIIYNYIKKKKKKKKKRGPNLDISG